MTIACGPAPPAALNALHVLDVEERRRFAEDGYLVRPRAFPRAACDALCEHLSRTIARVAGDIARAERADLDFWSLLRRSRHALEVFWDLPDGRPPSTPPADWERHVMRVGHGLHRADAAFAEFCRAPPIAAPLAALVPAPARIVQTAIIYKQPRSSAVQFGMHQDASYLTAAPDTLTLAFTALDDMDEENGCLAVIPGSHTEGLGVELALSERGFVPMGAERPPRHPERARLLPMEKGSVIFVNGRTFHASGPNRSGRPRRALLVHAIGGGTRMRPTSWLTEPEGGFDLLDPSG